MMKNTKNRIVSALLAVCLTASSCPFVYTHAAEAEVTDPPKVEYTYVHKAHDQCVAGTSATVVTDFDGLQRALSDSSVTDVVIGDGDGGTISVTGTLTVSGTKHLTVAAGETWTLIRGADFKGNLIEVSAGETLILGDGAMNHATDDLTADAQKGDYEVVESNAMGQLIIDGGAVWTNGTSWEPGVSFGDNTGKTAVLYDEKGEQRQYSNAGTVTENGSLINSSGILSIWGGTTLQNNVKRQAAGSAIYSGNGSTLNMYGGAVQLCALASNDNDTGRGAVFVGNFATGNWNSDVTITDTHFNMYGGKITRNAASGGANQDGGGVSVEQAYMDMYGGEVSYNHAGVYLNNEASGDGGGLMVRNNAQFTLWGGKIRHNFAGGYGGGVVAWNATVNIKGGSVEENLASYGGGVAIASSNGQDGSAVTAKVIMTGGSIAYNEAIQTATTDTQAANAGVGGGICAGSDARSTGSTLELKGGTITCNKAANGGGLGVYAGGAKAEGNAANTAVNLSGSFAMTTNSATYNGNGMYIKNKTSENRHYLVTLSGGARISTDNSIYFENICTDQVPVKVTGKLTADGVVGLLEFSDTVWSTAAAGTKIVAFEGVPVQENKFSLESSAWYLKDDTDKTAGAATNHLTLAQYSGDGLYTYRNGTGVVIEGKTYYRLYDSLAAAVNDAADGDKIYTVYNATITTPVKLDGKNVSLVAENTSSASLAAATSGGAWSLSYYEGQLYAHGQFLLYDTASGTSTLGDYEYYVRNDYTITLSKYLYLGESSRSSDGTTPAAQAAITVTNGSLSIGEKTELDMGSGLLTFDGNYSAVLEGPMIQVGSGGAASINTGITLTNHTNLSQAHPGVVEVLSGGSFTMNAGTITNNVSPLAGAVYNNGLFTMKGGTIGGNHGAMPRYGFSAGTAKHADYDQSYWGQPKYYHGAGAVYNNGTFVMEGGTITGNRGEYGAVANGPSGAMDLKRGTITGNVAWSGTGAGSDYDLTITGYTEGKNPAVPTSGSDNAGSGGALYIMGSGTNGTVKNVTVGSGMVISGNLAQYSGGAIAVAQGKGLDQEITDYLPVSGGQQEVVSSTTTTTPSSNTYSYAQHTGTTLPAGDYFIANNDGTYLLAANGTSGVTSTALSTATSDSTAYNANCIWTIAPTGTDASSVSLYNKGAQRYLVLSSSGNSYTLSLSSENNGSITWISRSNNTFGFLLNTARYLRYYNGWTVTDSTSGINLRLYKLTTTPTSATTVTTTTQSTVTAAVPSYTPTVEEGASASVTVVTGAEISGNTANSGGGVFVSGADYEVKVQSGVLLRRNAAIAVSNGDDTSWGTGGAASVEAGGSLTFANELYENSARLGGGLYVGPGGIVSATGDINGNSASGRGGGVYIAPGSDTGSGGVFTLNGGRINGNTAGTGALGVGVYNGGELVLQGGAYINHADTVHLAQGKTIQMEAGWETGTANTVTDRLTITLDDLEDGQAHSSGTDVIRTISGTGSGTDDHARALLAAGKITCKDSSTNYPLAVRGSNSGVIEINFNSVTYFDRLTSADGAESHSIVKAYGSGETVTVQNFSVSDQFVSPTGMTFSHWVRVAIDADGSAKTDGKNNILYLTTSGAETTEIGSAARYNAGGTFEIRENVMLAAVYSDLSYRVLVNITGSGSVRVDGASTDAANQLYTGNNVALGITAAPEAVEISGRTVDTLLDSLLVYQRITWAEYLAAADRSDMLVTTLTGVVVSGTDLEELITTADTNFREENYRAWSLRTTAVMESQALPTVTAAGPAGGTGKTVYPSGKIINVRNLDGVTASAGEGKLSYTTQASDVLIMAAFCEAYVKMVLTNTEDGATSAPYYYDSLFDAYRGMYLLAQGEAHKDHIHRAAYTLMKSNVTGETATVEVDGQTYERFLFFRDPTTTDRAPSTLSINHDRVIDLNGFALDLQTLGTSVINGNNAITYMNGAVVAENAGGTLIRASSTAQDGAEPATITIDHVVFQVPDGVYTAEVHGNGRIQISATSRVGRVFLETTEDHANSPTLDLLDNGRAGGGGVVATICLDNWSFDSGVNPVLTRHEGITDAEGNNIRRAFVLEDVGTDAVDDAARWFIGTDGVLYRKAAAVVPGQSMTLSGGEDYLTTSWDYTTDGSGAPISSTRTSGFVYYRYNHAYSIPTGTRLAMWAQVKDAYGENLTTAGGTVSFIASRYVENNVAERVLTSGSISMVGGEARSEGGSGFSMTLMPANAGTVDQDKAGYGFRAIWTGSGQYAPAYASLWVYDDPAMDGETDRLKATEGLFTVHVDKKSLADDSVTIDSMGTASAEYIGPAGREGGYTSAPEGLIIGDGYTGLRLYAGSDYRRIYAELTTDPDLAVKVGGVATPLVSGGVTYYYKADAVGGMIWYTDNGSGNLSGTDLANAKPLNGAAAGVYSVELEALDTSENYTGRSGWKGRVFTITPYTGILQVLGTNHIRVDVGDADNPVDIYANRILEKYLATENGEDMVRITDRYGNVLSKQEVDMTFEIVSGGARLSDTGWPMAQGLYNVAVRPYGHTGSTAGTLPLPDDYEAALAGRNTPNYASAATGYLTVLVTNDYLTAVVVPNNVKVPYTGQVYTDAAVKTFDNADEPDTGYAVYLVKIDRDQEGAWVFDRPVTEVFPDGKIPAFVTEAGLVENGMTCIERRLTADQYRLEIGSPKHTPQTAGKYTLVVTDIKNQYVGIGTLEIVSGAVDTITLSEEAVVYTGRGHSPTVTVRDKDGNVLVNGRDYTVRITNTTAGANTVVASPTTAGTYAYTAIGTGNFAGSAVATFTVVPKRLDNVDVTGGTGYAGPLTQLPIEIELPDVMVETGSVLVPNIKVYHNGALLSSDIYAETFTNTETNETTDNIKDPGTYRVNITAAVGSQNYTMVAARMLTVVARGAIRVTNQEEVYSGVPFSGYSWDDGWSTTDQGTRALLSTAGKAVIETDRGAEIPLYYDRCDVTLHRVENNVQTLVGEDEVLNAGTYLITVRPKAEYLDDLAVQSGLKAEDLVGYGVFVVGRRPVILTAADSAKVYGEKDPAFTYTTNLASMVGDPSQLEGGLFKADAANVYGQLGREPGEDVGGYHYNIGTFGVLGDNYVFTVDQGNQMLITPKTLSDSAAINVNVIKALPYTGYAQNPIRQVVYSSAALGEVVLAENADYVLSYEHWVGGTYEVDGVQHTYTPEDAGAQGHWESMAHAPADVGWYQVTVTGTGNYEHTRKAIFRVAQATSTMTLNIVGDTTVTYKGGDYTPQVTVTNQGYAVGANNYELTYSYTDTTGVTTAVAAFFSGATGFENAGTYTIYLTGVGNYTGASGQATFTILPKDLAAGDTAGNTHAVSAVVEEYNATYTGSPITPDVTVTYGGSAAAGETPDPALTLVRGTDFVLSYADHINAGTATVTLRGIGNYTGTLTKNYSITRHQLYVKVDGATKQYGAADPALTYTVYNDSAAADPVSVSVTGSADWDDGEGNVGQYDLRVGSLSAGSNYDVKLIDGQKFVITPKVINVDNDLAEYMSDSVVGYVSTATVKTVSDLVSTMDKVLHYWAPDLGHRELVLNTDYAVTVTDGATNVNGDLVAGQTYTVTFTALESSNYTGSVSRAVTAVDASYILNLEVTGGSDFVYALGGHTVTITAKKSDSAAVAVDFTLTGSALNGKEIKMVEQSGSSELTYTLTEAGTYTVTAVMTEGEGERAATYFGSVTLTVRPKNIAEGNTDGGTASITLNPRYTGISFPYTGDAVKFNDTDTLLVYGDYEEGSAANRIPAEDEAAQVTNYVLNYKNNVNPGTAAVTIYGTGNYSGTRTLNFTVGEIRYGVTYRPGMGSGQVPTDTALYKVGETVVAMANMGLSYTYTDGAGKSHAAVFAGWSSYELSALVDTELPADTVQAGGGVKMGDGPVILHAVWAADNNDNGKADYLEGKITVRYDAGLTSAELSGAVPTDPSTYLPGVSIKIMTNDQNLSLRGYMLLGWTTAVPGTGGHKLATSGDFLNFAGTIYSEGAVIAASADVVLYAVWTVDTDQNGNPDWTENTSVLVFYDGNGGEGETPAPGQTVRGGTYPLAAIPANLVRSGAVFLGWSDSRIVGLVNSCTLKSDGVTYRYYVDGVEQTVYGPQDNYAVPASRVDPIIIYAVWAADVNNNGVADMLEDRYTVTYSNGCGDVTVAGTLPTPVGGQLSGTSVSLPAAPTGTYTVNGETKNATFLFWTTNAADAAVLYGSGKQPATAGVAAGAPYTVTGDVVFYPVWAVEDHTLETVDIYAQVSTTSDSGTVTPASQSVFKGDSATITITPAAGWLLDVVYVERADKTNDAVPNLNGTYTLTLAAVERDTTVFVRFKKASLNLTLNGDTLVYDPGRTVADILRELSYTVTDGNGESVENYTLTIENHGSNAVLGAGSYAVIATGSHASITDSATLTITPKSITEGMVSAIGSQVYTGSAIVPGDIAVTDGDKLISGQDYTVTCYDNTAVGTAAVIITGQGNYTGTVVRSFIISEKIITVKPDSHSIVYGEKDPELTYTLIGGEGVIVSGALTRLPGEDVGEYAYDVSGLYVEGKSGIGFRLADDASKFQITQKDIAGDHMTLNTFSGDGSIEMVASGSPVSPVFQLTYDAADFGLRTLTRDRNFTVSYKQGETVLTGAPAAAGSYTIVLTGIGNYTGTREISLTIKSADTSLAVTATGNVTYTGQAFDPVEDLGLTVKADGAPLIYGTDYTYQILSTVPANTEIRNVAAYRILVTGKDGTDYAGYSGYTTVIVNARNINDDGVTVTGNDDQTYTGSAITLEELKLRDQGNAMTKDTDYTVVGYYANVNAGTASVTLAGTGNFTGTRVVEFRILPLDASGAAVTAGDAAYDGHSHTGDPVVTLNSAALVEGTDYTISYQQGETPVTKPTNAGEYTVIATFKGNYTGAASGTFTIRQRSLTDPAVTATAGSFTYTGVSREIELQVTFGSFTLMPGADYELVGYYRAGETAPLSGIPVAAGSYQVEIRGLNNYCDTQKVDFTISAANSFTIEAIAPATYNGTAHKPQPAVTDGTKTLTLDVDYRLSYADNIDAGTATVTVTGLGNYAGVSVERSFIIEPASLTSVTVAEGNHSYTGAAIEPGITVRADALTVPAAGYDVVFQNNVNAGTATVTVTGKGNYAGTVGTVSFGITARPLNEEGTVRPAQGIVLEPIADLAFTGQALRPAPIVKDNGMTITAGRDYTVAYANNVQVGTATVTITGMGNYMGTLEQTFVITGAVSTQLTVIPAGEEFVYTGQVIKPGVTVKLPDGSVLDDDYYDVVYTRGSSAADPIQAGVYTIRVTGKDTYAGYSGTVTYSIIPKDLSEGSAAGAGAVELGAILAKPWTSHAVTPDVSMTYNGMDLDADDFTLSYTLGGAPCTVPVAVGVYDVTITGRGNYTGSRTASFAVSGEGSTIFTVKYFANNAEGQVPTDSSRYLINDEVTILDHNTLERSGAVFLGWTTGAQDLLTGTPNELTIYVPGKTFNIGASMELYALWAEDKDENGTPDYAQSYTITATAGANGSVTVPNEGKVDYLGSCTVTITPDAGYVVDRVIVDSGKEMGHPDSYTFTEVKADHTIHVTFKAISGTSAAYSVEYAGKTFAGYGLTLKYTDQYGLEHTVDNTCTVTVSQGGQPVDGTAVLTAGEYGLRITRGQHLKVDTTLTVTARPLADSMVTSGVGSTYTGQALSANVAVSDGGSDLTIGADYTVTYYRNGIAVDQPLEAGSYTVVIGGIGSYTGAVTRAFVVDKAVLTVTPGDNGKVYGDKDGVYAYTVEPAAHSAALEGGLSRQSGESAGEYAYTLGTLRDAGGNYDLVLDESVSFVIRQKSIADTLNAGQEDLDFYGLYALRQEGGQYVMEVPYTGKPMDTAFFMTYVTDLFGTAGMEQSRDFTLGVEPAGQARALVVLPTAAGEYTITVTGAGNYCDDFSFLLRIVASSEALAVHCAGPVTYSAGVQTPALTVTAGETTLTDADYSVAYTDAATGQSVTEPKAAGVYRVTVTGRDGYEGRTGMALFRILPKDIGELTADAIADQLYTGSAIVPAVELEWNGETADTAVTYQGNISVGTAAVVLSGRGNYTGTKTVNFLIKAQALVAADPADVTYDGRVHYLPPASLTAGAVPVTGGYTLDYSPAAPMDAGPVTVTVTMNDGSGAVTGYSYQILKKSIEDESKIKLTVDDLYLTGYALTPNVSAYYQVDGSTRLYMLRDADYTVEFYSDPGCTTAVSEIKTVGTYYARFTGTGSNYEGSRVVAFRVTGTLSDVLHVTLTGTDVVYNGMPQTIGVGSVVINGITLGEDDYTVAYNGDHTNVGTVTVTVSGKGSYAGSWGMTTFEITPRDINEAELTPPADQTYTGGALSAQPALQYNGSTLAEGRDYTLIYTVKSTGASVAAPVMPGTYVVTIVGVNNFTGSRATEFTVNDVIHSYTITATGGQGGTVTATGSTVVEGSSVTVTIRPDGGYQLGDVIVDGAVVTPVEQPDGSCTYTFTDIRENHSLVASFRKNAVIIVPPSEPAKPTTGDVIVAVGLGGSVTVDGITVAGGTNRTFTLKIGETLRFTVETDRGYDLVSVLLDARDLGALEAGSAKVTEKDRVIQVSFRKRAPQWDPDMPTLTGSHVAYVNGLPDGTFNAVGTITRAEVAVIYTRLITGKMEAPEVEPSGFSDVDPDKWYAPYIAFLEDYHIIDGYPDGRFGPDDPITRGEMCALVTKFFVSEKPVSETVFPDVTPSHWAYGYIMKAYDLGFVEGYPNGKFGPNDYMSRGEVVTISNRIMGRRADLEFLEEHSDEIPHFSDLSRNHWAYDNIMEAAVGHDHETSETGETWTGLH